MYSDHHSKTKHIMLKFELIDETGGKIARGYYPAIRGFKELQALIDIYAGDKRQ